MPSMRSCAWCREGRYHSDPRKHFRDCHLCYHCMITADLVIKHLAPASERKARYTEAYGSSGCYKAMPHKANLGTLAKDKCNLVLNF